MNGMAAEGFTGESFNSTEKISQKWRYLFSQYKKVKDNNGKTGRNRMKFRYYEAMNTIIRDSEAISDVIEPNFVQSENEPITTEKRNRSTGDTGKQSAQRDHYSNMERLQEQYNTETLRLQAKAVELEEKKLELLKQLLNKK